MSPKSFLTFDDIWMLYLFLIFVTDLDYTQDELPSSSVDTAIDPRRAAGVPRNKFKMFDKKVTKGEILVMQPDLAYCVKYDLDPL